MQIYNNRNEKPFWELRETGCEQNDRIFCIYPKKHLYFVWKSVENCCFFFGFVKMRMLYCVCAMIIV